MQSRSTISSGAVLAAIAVVLGAFGAHALKDSLLESGQLENWHTAVRYQMWHALALVLYGLFRQGREGRWVPAWCFLIGGALFSGSIYCLCFGMATAVMGPLTPLGGALLIVGWGSFAVQAARAAQKP